MNFTLSLEQVNTILRALDQMPHAQVRQLIDVIVAEANAQIKEQPAQAPAQEEVE